VTGTFAYSVDGFAGVTAIMRRDFGSPQQCVWNSQLDPAAATNYTDTWWQPGEPGWALSIAHHGDSIFALWLTYGLDGQPRWMAAHLDKTATGTFGGSIELVPQPGRNRYLYEPPGNVAGSASITFANGNDATFEYSVNGYFWTTMAGSRKITRQVFTSSATVCH
jgi:hypothetical protein